MGFRPNIIEETVGKEEGKFGVEVHKDFGNNPLMYMKRHPNYQAPRVLEGETQTQFILRSIAELISPEQFVGESYDLECVAIKKAVLDFEIELDEVWKNH